MLNHQIAQLAFRARAATLSVATTGSTSLSATATGYARAAGSFLTDGFAVGMEITPTGFVSNPVDILIGVTASTLTTKNARSVEAAAGGRTLAVGLPTLRALENVAFTPTAGRPWVDEDWVPGTSSLLTLPGQSGQIEETGLSIWKWYGLPDVGITAISKSVQALMALFTPGTALTLSDGTIVRVRGDDTVKRGQIIPDGNGWSVVTITIPWRAYTVNAIAA